jgi:Tol biopolymer transport system component
VYAADLSQIDASGGTELRIYNLADRTHSDLTTNRANLIESAPDWSPDAQQIVFQAREAANADVDIYTIPAVGGAAQKIIDSDFDDIQPRYSPDGRYLVFSSNRSGNWDVYIYEIATQTYYQVTSARQTDIANDWGN